jgi:GalNAc-alpha-(1->4)-GalNAc-alpha-(1->3)-diNAcBac-PP-undecaprenol alpha-1,4-N-acetyl-D-galactosaminyltransferase
MNHSMNAKTENKKILIVSHGIGDGGAQRVTAMLVNGFFDKGYDVRVVTSAPSDNEYKLKDGVEYYPIIAGQKHTVERVLYRIKEIRKNIIDFRPDYILTLSAIPNMMTIIARGMHKIDIVVSERTDPSKHPDNRLAVILRNILYHLPKRIVFQTEEARDYFPETIRNKGMIIPNALTPTLPEPYYGVCEKVIVGVGSLSDQKDWMTGIKAFELLAKENKDYRLVIYGDGIERDKLEEYIENCSDLKDRVSLPGFVSDVHEKIKNASVFISSSRYDGISNSILEAMGLGLPCVCTDAPVGGARYLIKDHENGILVPVGDYYQMYQALKSIVENDELKKRLGKNATYVRSKFDYKRILNQWEKVLIL